MGVKLVVAVTDKQWFDLLRQKPELPEVNFWAPSGAGFQALSRGELFLFCLGSPLFRTGCPCPRSTMQRSIGT